MKRVRWQDCLEVGVFLMVLTAAVAIGQQKPAESGRARNPGLRRGEQARRNVPYRRIRASAYQNFLMNWDSAKHPVLFGNIQTPAQYKALFGGAPIMGDRRPFGPEKELYTREQIFVVGRVIGDCKDFDKVFTVTQVTEKNNKLVIRYRIQKSVLQSVSLLKDWLTLRLPRRSYTTATLYENGRRVGKLNLAEGQWSVPSAPAPDKEAHGDKGTHGISDIDSNSPSQ